MRWRRSSHYVLALQVSWLLTTCGAFPRSLPAQMATEDRLLYRGWWPRHSTNSRDGYVGPPACARCHAEKAATQPKTPMGRTSAPVGDSKILAGHDHLNFQSGKISYSIATRAGKSFYSVSDGTNSSSAALVWSFGDGHIGQSYLFERDGNLYESRMSYFGTLKAFGDIWNDGAMDVLILKVGEPTTLLRNHLNNGNHWVEFKLQGTKSNRAALGARVTIHSGQLSQFNEVRGGGSYLSQDDLRLHFGLGANSKTDSVEIAWPSCLVEHLDGPAVDQIYTIEEGKGIRAHKNPTTP
jgi:hypothetical protein